MDQEQLVTQMQWLIDEHQRDKAAIAALEDHIQKLEETIRVQDEKIRAFRGDLAKATTMASRVTQFDEMLAQVRLEFKRQIEDTNKKNQDAARKQEEEVRGDINEINTEIKSLKKELLVTVELDQRIRATLDEVSRINELVAKNQKAVLDIEKGYNEIKRVNKMFDDQIQKDTKRLSDAQVEITALRKRVEENRSRLDVTMEIQQKSDARLAEYAASESDRKQAQMEFIENQKRLQVDREKTIKDWREKIATLDTLKSDLQVQLRDMDATQRAVRQSQSAMEDVTARFERRINELSEMQRLVEERFRQEWVSFKADDQKRWTNYTLSGEEQQREYGRQMTQIMERLVSLEDITQELQDSFVHFNEETNRSIRGFLTSMQTWSESLDRFSRKP